MKNSLLNKTTLLFSMLSLALGLNLYAMDQSQAYDHNALIARKNSGNFDPKKTALLWDMSGVLLGQNRAAAKNYLLKDNTSATVTFLLSIKNKLQNLESAEQALDDISKSTAQKSWWTWSKSWLDENAVEEDTAYWKKFLQGIMTVSQIPHPETIELFKAAKKAVLDKGLGFTGIFSNNGPTLFEIHSKKVGFEFLKDAISITGSTNETAKPNKQAYEMAKNTVLGSNSAITTFILIDDNKDNVKGAQENGIYGIYYSNKTDDPSDLRKKLVALGLLANEETDSSTSTSHS